MFATQDRARMREVFFRAWRRQRTGEPLEGIEQTIVAIAQRHPEYHALLENPDAYQDRDYSVELGETNPFLHLAMHVAIEEQLALDQPRGIREHHRRLLAQLPDEHAAQHRIMECLAETLWRAGRDGGAPSDAIYLDCLARLTGRPAHAD